MIRFFRYLRFRPLGIASLGVLCFLYLVMIFAEFIAPYGAGTSFPEQSCHPPNLRLYRGRLQAQECEVINTVNWNYVRVRGRYAPLRFFAKGEPYKLWGLIPLERHLFVTDTSQGELGELGELGEPGESNGASGYPVFLMGTDNLGRDLFSRIIHGSRISLTIGFIATAISLFLAMLFGGLAGYFGGKTDWTIMRFAEFFMLIPGLYLILFLRSLLSSTMDSGKAYMMITVILSLVGWPGSARTIRGMVHAIKREEFVQNARLEMIPAPVIIFTHIIPQISSLLIVSVALSVPGFIMTETTLSYLGLGISEPAVSWGSLIRRDISTLSSLLSYPWLLNPVWFLLAVTLAFNFLGDCLRDYYDPYHTVFAPRLRLFRELRNRLARNRETPAGELRTNKPPGVEPPVSGPAAGEPAAGKPNPPLLEVRDLSVRFSLRRGRETVFLEAVRNVSFRLREGETLGIVGESGSGKSAATGAIPALLPGNAVSEGSIRWEGRELLGAQPGELRSYRGKKIGMIFQEPGRSYDPLQNMEKVFLETFRSSEPGIGREAAREKAAALLAEAGLDRGRERLSNFPHQFSGGQLQRIGIALALAQNCRLLIADEPTTALDVTIQHQIMELLKKLRQKRGLSIIFISHDIDLVADIAGRIIVMYGGLVMEEGPTALVRAGPRHPYTKALLDSSPRFGSHYGAGPLPSIPGRVTDPARPEPGCPFAPRCSRSRRECTASLPPLREAGDGRALRCFMEEE